MPDASCPKNLTCRFDLPFSAILCLLTARLKFAFCQEIVVNICSYFKAIKTRPKRSAESTTRLMVKSIRQKSCQTGKLVAVQDCPQFVGELRQTVVAGATVGATVGFMFV